MTDLSVGVLDHADEFLQLFRRGEEFTRELIAEIERLRGTLASVSRQLEDASRDEGEWEKLRQGFVEKIQGLEGERDDVRAQLRAVERENHVFAERYVDVAEQNSAFANLYVASYSLHSTLDLSEVLRVVIEIVINLIGAEVFAIYILDEATGALEPLAAEGVERSLLPRVRPGAGAIGSAVEAGEIRCDETKSAGDLENPIACIPLKVSDRTVGALAIFGLLSHKKRFTSLDQQLFTLLAGHAATAIFAAQLYGQTQRKLLTIQGAIDLLLK